jgi:hypothetical protein
MPNLYPPPTIHKGPHHMLAPHNHSSRKQIVACVGCGFGPMDANLLFCLCATGDWTMHFATWWESTAFHWAWQSCTSWIPLNPFLSWCNFLGSLQLRNSIGTLPVYITSSTPAQHSVFTSVLLLWSVKWFQPTKAQNSKQCISLLQWLSSGVNK